MAKNNPKFGYVAILGETNAGKSTLVNRLVGAKISIVSPKVQTTRSRIQGILVGGDTQLVLVDTPGIFNPKRRLDRAMIASAFGGADESDIRLLVVDAKKGLTPSVEKIITHLEKNNQSAILAINKIDLVAREKLLPLIAAFNRPIFSETFLVSALTGEHIPDLKNALLARTKPGPWMFDPEQITDLPNRLFAAEITREKTFLFLAQELPYATAVETTAFHESNGTIRIDQTVYVQKDGQKAIILGRGGSMIKKIGASARLEMQKIFNSKVNLFLTVKVKENWHEDPAQYAAWGLDYDA